jgi:phage terminase large subunit-like protein
MHSSLTWERRSGSSSAWSGYSRLARPPQQAPYLAELKRMGFPHLVHDDQVDSVTQFLMWVKER